MNILVAVAWMWMAAQHGHIEGAVSWPQAAQTQHIQIRPNDRTDEWYSTSTTAYVDNRCAEGTWISISAPDGSYDKIAVCHDGYYRRLSEDKAEHVIEIRTKRDEAHPQCPATWVNFDETAKACKCPTGYPLVIEGDAALSSVDCIRVTREIWIDGKKWGVLKESGQ